MERKESNDENKYRAKLLLYQKNYILKTKRITAVKFDEIKEYISLKIWNDRDYTRGMNGDKVDKNDKERQRRDQESNSTGLGKIENNKHPGAGEQHAVKNKLKEALQTMLL